MPTHFRLVSGCFHTYNKLHFHSPWLRTDHQSLFNITFPPSHPASPGCGPQWNLICSLFCSDSIWKTFTAVDVYPDQFNLDDEGWEVHVICKVWLAKGTGDSYMREVTFTAVHVAKSKEIMESLGKHPQCYYILFLFLFGAKNLRKTEKILFIISNWYEWKLLTNHSHSLWRQVSIK